MGFEPKGTFMGVSDSQHFRKTLLGVCMNSAPLLLLGAFAVSPKLEAAATKMLAVTAQHPDRAFISTLVAMVGVALLLGAVLGLTHMMRERGAGYGNVGGSIAALGVLGVMATFSVGFMVWLMAKDGVTAADAHLLHR